MVSLAQQQSGGIIHPIFPMTRQVQEAVCTPSFRSGSGHLGRLPAGLFAGRDHARGCRDDQGRAGHLAADGRPAGQNRRRRCHRRYLPGAARQRSRPGVGRGHGPVRRPGADRPRSRLASAAVRDHDQVHRDPRRGAARALRQPARRRGQGDRPGRRAVQEHPPGQTVAAHALPHPGVRRPGGFIPRGVHPGDRAGLGHRSPNARRSRRRHPPPHVPDSPRARSHRMSQNRPDLELGMSIAGQRIV